MSHPPGRKKDVKYSEEVAALLIERYSSGETLTSIGKDENMPDRSNVWRWTRAYPEFSATLSDAREAHADALADEITDIADTERDPQKARNRIDARKWVAGVMNPARYSPKVDLNITERIDLTDARTKALARVARSVHDQLPSDASQALEVIEQGGSVPTDEQSVDKGKPDIFD